MCCASVTSKQHKVLESESKQRQDGPRTERKDTRIWADFSSLIGKNKTDLVHKDRAQERDYSYTPKI